MRKGGLDDTARGPAWGRAQLDDYMTHRYRQPSDQYPPDWDVRGALDDLTLYYEVGIRVARSRRFPRWYPNSEFRVSRDTVRAVGEARRPRRLALADPRPVFLAIEAAGGIVRIEAALLVRRLERRRVHTLELPRTSAVCRSSRTPKLKFESGSLPGFVVARHRLPSQINPNSSIVPVF